MTCRFKTGVLALALAGGVSDIAAQEDCNGKISSIEKIRDVQAALSCVDKRVADESERTRREEENNKKQLLQNIANLEIVATNARSVPLKEATNGNWKEIPDSDGAHICFVSSIRLPPQGLCQVAYQGATERWSYNISDPTAAGFMCIATCVSVELRRKPPANN